MRNATHIELFARKLWIFQRCLSLFGRQNKAIQCYSNWMRYMNWRTLFSSRKSRLQIMNDSIHTYFVLFVCHFGTLLYLLSIKSVLNISHHLIDLRYKSRSCLHSKLSLFSIKISIWMPFLPFQSVSIVLALKYHIKFIYRQRS